VIFSEREPAAVALRGAQDIADVQKKVAIRSACANYARAESAFSLVI
jgi:hypothetical protein